MTQLHKILIVDDMPTNIQLAGNILRKQNYDISFAESGASALKLVTKHDYDLILLDIMMPQMSGFDVCRKLKENQSTKDIPVIFLTAKSDNESISEGFRVGGVDYIVKPFNTEELVARVRTHIDLRVKELKLAEAIVAKDKFLAIIAHDLKNPFNSMLGFTELLRKHVARYDKEKIEKISELLYFAAKNGFTLLENLLQWSRNQNGTIHFNPQNILLNTIIDRNLNLLRSNAEQKQINLLSSCSENISLFADENMLDTVIRNLLTNAIKFTQQNGVVYINVTHKSQFAEIEVIDNGIGISAEDMKKLFRIDENISKPGTGGEKGTGLGLILCKEFVERNKGKISVESAVNQGSTFRFSIPIADVSEK